MDKGGRVGNGPITTQEVIETVAGYGLRVWLGKITPHDLRRTNDDPTVLAPLSERGLF